MSFVLLAAALYNLCWAAWFVFSPVSAFKLAGLASPRYPELWQGMGIMVGVYGFGYAIAATDPLRHWPIVLIGLGARIVEPVGFAHAAAQKRVPWNVAWVIIVNDLIWWVPFGLILLSAWRQHQSRIRSFSPDVLPLALRTRTDEGISIEQMSRFSPVLLVFLRHAGCTFCREALADLAKQRRSIEGAGANIVLVHMGEAEFGREFFRRYGLDHLPQISDPHCTLYRAFGLRKGTMRMLFGPKVWWRGFDAGVLHRHGIGLLAGDGFQMPGVFLVFHGQLLRCFRHQSAADRPDYLQFVKQNITEPVS